MYKRLNRWHPDQGGWGSRRSIFIDRIPFLLVERPEYFGIHRRLFLYDEGQCIWRPMLGQDLLTTTSASAQTYTSKADWRNNRNTIEAIGGGGAGAIGAGTTSSGGGGGGGAYNRIDNFQITTPGTTTFSFFVQAGLLHTGTYPGTAPDSGFGNAVLASSNILAKGGVSPATSTTATGGSGGLASGGIPTTSPPGRNGGSGGTAAAATSSGGGGGGAGGPNGIGATAGTGPSAGGTADGGKVAGGAAGSPGVVGNTGTEWDATNGCGSGGGGGNASPSTGGNGGKFGGGGGGGGRSTGVGGDGAQGIVVLQWSPDVQYYSQFDNPDMFTILRTAVTYR